MSSTQVASPFDFHACVPFGDDLRVLLNSDFISPGSIHDLLKEKGIFVGTSDKKTTVPILASTLLTPPEFTRLIDVSYDRERAPKIRKCTYDLERADADWVSVIRQEFKGNALVELLGASGAVVIKSPQMLIEKQNLVTFQYTLSKKDFSQDWIMREVDYQGEITLEQKGTSLVLEVGLSRTSKETDEFNRRILSRASSALKINNMIRQEEAKKITYGSLQDFERVLFFKRLTTGTAGSLELGSVNDMDIGRDAGMPKLPDDPKVSWLNQTVKRLVIDGDRLNDIFLISDDAYYKHYYVQRMDVTYEYTFGQNSGTTRISFHFSPCKPEYRDSAEFEFSVASIKSSSGRLNVDAKRNVNKLIHDSTHAIIDREFLAIVAARRNALSD